MLTGKFILVLTMCVRATSGEDVGVKCVEIQLSDPMTFLECRSLEAYAVKYEDIWDEDINCIEAHLRVHK